MAEVKVQISVAEKLSSGSLADINDAIKIYKDLSLDPSKSLNDRVNTFLSLNKYIHSEAPEMLSRWRDMIPHVPAKERDAIINILTTIAKNPDVDAHERCIIAVEFYNRCLLGACFKCFESLAIDTQVSPKYRAEACRYLYSTEDESNREIAQECLLNIIEDFSLSSDYRYSIITSFISKSGVKTYLNDSKIRVAYYEEFVYTLQHTFFFEVNNGVRERILSGQHILQMECPSQDVKIEVCTSLLAISTSDKYSENTRADAADVVYRLAAKDTFLKEFSLKARDIINELGHSAVNIRSDNILDRIKTIYTNSQNIHDEPIANMVNTFIEKMLSGDIVPVTFDETAEEVRKLVRSKKLGKEKPFTIYKAINRIGIDTATFSSKNATLAEIFVHVWLRIKTYDGQERSLLEGRFIEELLDMGDTCSSGHAGRFVNVLSAVDPELDLKISFESQIISNVAGRVNAQIRDTKDIEIKGSIALGMLPDADKDDRDIYKKFITEAIASIKVEMQKEFVEGKYLSLKEFDTYFSKASSQWVNW